MMKIWTKGRIYLERFIGLISREAIHSSTFEVVQEKPENFLPEFDLSLRIKQK